MDTVYRYGLYFVKSWDTKILCSLLYFCYTFDCCLCSHFVSCIVKLCDICECSLLGCSCILHSSIDDDQIHIQAIIERMMDPWNIHVCVRVRTRACVCMRVCFYVRYDIGSNLKIKVCRTEVLTAVLLRICVFRNATLCSLSGSWCFKRTVTHDTA